MEGMIWGGGASCKVSPTDAAKAVFMILCFSCGCQGLGRLS